MKAVAFEGADKALAIHDIPMPEPGPGQLLLKVAACGICGSDLHAYQAALSPEGNVFGHEFSGEVAAVGEGVTDWQVGDRAVSLGAMFCGLCENCQQGLYEQCENLELIGFSRHGAYAEYVITQAAASTGYRMPSNTPRRRWWSPWRSVSPRSGIASCPWVAMC